MLRQEAHRVAVFDINGTLYRKSSKEEFFKYICFKNGYKLLDIYHLITYKLLGKAHLINQTRFKENFFNYLDDIPPETVQRYASEYWSIEYPQYFNQELLQRVKKLKDEGIEVFCISGGLDVYIRPLFRFFEVDEFYCTVTRYQDGTYLIDGKACKGDVKLERLKSHFAEEPYRIVEAYSDDPEPLLEEAENAYIVTPQGKVKPFES